MNKMNQLMLWLFLIYGCVNGSLACAHPTQPMVIRGNANFEMNGTSLIIHTSDKTHIYWDDFSIAENELLEIVQPSADSKTVIQVEGPLPSVIAGILKTNGQLYLINPQGLKIDPNGFIDAEGFLATTFPTCVCTLLDNVEDPIFQGQSLAPIVNQGRIKALEHVYLIGYQISNNGSIYAPQGIAALAAGQNILLQPSQAQKITVFCSSIKEEETGIDNAGKITACRVELNADGTAYSVAIRHAGMIDALGSADQSGEIHLLSEKGAQGIFGAITAENADKSGGKIDLFGEHIALFEHSTIDASGDHGGGTIHIGSVDEDKQTKTVFIDQEVVISADAIKKGNGGKVIIEAEEITNFYGTISACGGEEYGDGGNIEVFSRHPLNFNGMADFSAPQGKSGSLLLDFLRK
jgi:filamentous hemagglutinin family protein